jgi:hypothetical protein
MSLDKRKVNDWRSLGAEHYAPKGAKKNKNYNDIL